MKLRQKIILVLVCMIVMTALSVGVIAMAIGDAKSVVISSEGLLSVGARLALAAQSNISNSYGGAILKAPAETTVTPTSWGYVYNLENGDVIQVGDNTTTDFKAHVKAIRGTGVSEFSFGLAGGSFVPSVDNLTISFDFNDDIHVAIYPVMPCDRLPEGGIEYDITLNSRPAQNSITLDIDWKGIIWKKILPLNEQYDDSACIAEWGDSHDQFVLTQTDVTGRNLETLEIETLKHIELYEVNSYIGKANEPIKVNSGDLGGGVSYTRISRSYLHIHRGIMTDALGDTAWVEDIELNESKKQITFTLPRTWLRNASYPVSQVCGLDPAYTEAMDVIDGTGFTEGAWTAYDIEATDGYTSDMVIEFIITNDDAGKQFYGGVRTYGSSLPRYIELHEAESGGCTTVRMFVQPTDNAGSGNIEYYSQDNSDIIFTVVGYWENVDFTELWAGAIADASSSWEDETLSAGASVVHHILGYVGITQDQSDTGGVRANGSSLERKVLIHEAEGDGWSVLDWMVKADASNVIELYSSDNSRMRHIDTGYFGSELDFVELFETLVESANWNLDDISEHLDQDGRVVDCLLLNDYLSSTAVMGVRDGDDSTTERSIEEHEAENDAATGEFTGFGMSAKTNASGQIYVKSSLGTQNDCKLMGYFKPTVAGEPDISVDPTVYDFGTVSANSTSNTTTTYFTITNSSPIQTDQTIGVTTANWSSGGTPWIHDDTGTAGANTAALKAQRGGTWGDNVIVVKYASPEYIYENCSANTSYGFGLSLLAPTSFSDGEENSIIVRVTATAG